MSTNIWDESSPQNTDRYQDAALALRSLKTVISSNLSQSVYWPGTAGGSVASAGQLVLGATRAFYAAQSAYSVPSPVTQGTLFASNNLAGGSIGPRLFGATTVSGATLFLGTNRLVEGLTWPGQTARWVVSTGTSVVSSGNTIAYGVTYDVRPLVDLGLRVQLSSEVSAAVVSIRTSTTTNFRLNVSNGSGHETGFSNPGDYVCWISEGTATF